MADNSEVLQGLSDDQKQQAKDAEIPVAETPPAAAPTSKRAAAAKAETAPEK